jgi:hypothetical protein
MEKTLARNKHLTIYSRTGYFVFVDWRFFDSDGIPQTSNYLFGVFQMPGTGGYKKKTKYMVNTGVKLTSSL